MDLTSRIQRLPLPYEPDRAAEALSGHGWLTACTGALRDLLAGMAGASPYLAGLLVRQGAWFETAIDDPEAAFQAELTALTACPPDQIGQRMRQAKARAALLIAAADLAGIWSLGQVTGALTQLAETATQAAMNAAIAGEKRRRKLRMLPEGASAAEAGLVAFAMGKMGAYELNYSSDIDLIMLIDDSRYEAADWLEARPALIRAVRSMASLLSERTAEGYVFRTDLRLRPDPAVTPVALSMDAAERYYESTGRAWERAAWVKARPCAGDIASGERFLKTLRPFIWRKHLDFAAIQEAHDMRLRIRAHKGHHGAICIPGHDLKLGRGGVREIEFFTQTRQIIAGGRDTSLRVRGTIAGLEALTTSGWVPADVSARLAAHYTALREAEHRVQMLNDAQTHILPENTETRAAVAALSGESLSAFDARLHEVLSDVHHMAEAFFAPGEAPACPQTAGPITARDLEQWESTAALRSDRARAHFARIRPRVLARLNEADRPEEAFEALGTFIAGLPAGVQLFALFEANPHLVDLLTDVTATTPALGRYLSQNVRVFDGVIAGDFFSAWPGTQALSADLGRLLSETEDYEHRLDRARAWAHEWHFRIGVHLLRGLISPEEAGAEYASLAEAVLAALWPVVEAEHARRHGPPPGNGAAVLGMGSLGAGRLTPSSDLDLIVIYDAEADAQSTGARPLAAPQYYAKLTKALVTALAAPMAEGRLYEADMRLRPSGNQGPVAASLKSWDHYQRHEAWIWEHFALTRARALAGSPVLCATVTARRAALLSDLGTRQDRAKVIAEMATMRARIRAAKAPEGGFDAKIGPGRMQEIELAAQAGLYLAGAESARIEDGLAALCQLGLISPTEQGQLEAAYALLSRVNITAKLVSEAALSETMAGAAADFVARATKQDDLGALKAALSANAAQADAVLTALETRQGQNA